MDLRTHIERHDGKLRRNGPYLGDLANTCEVSPYYLFMLAAGHKAASPILATRLQVATGGECSRRELCPEFPWDEPAVGGAAA